MAERPAPTKTASSFVSSGSKKVNWAELKPKSVDHEDAMSASRVAAVWARLYEHAGLTGLSEDQQAAVRLAVYKYCCINGTSRVGSYSGVMVTSFGDTVGAAVIPRAAGVGNVRKFLRGNMIDSYHAMKQSGCIEDDERFVAKITSLNLPSETAFATADWLTGCPEFTPAEAAAHQVSFYHGLERARRARGGKTLEEVEETKLAAGLATQGPMDSGNRDDTF